MTTAKRNEIRNVAIIAHVDHGKTTLVDRLLRQSAALRETGGDEAAVRRAVDPGLQKKVATMPKIVALPFRETRIHLLDTPSRADFGGETERTLRMADGLLLLVDACEGPLPQTRYALRKALEAGLPPIVVLTKTDLPRARPADVLEDVRALFVDLDAAEHQLAFPVLYCNALLGAASESADGDRRSLLPLFEEILRSVPAPTYDPEGPTQFLVTALDYDDFLGRLALGRLFNGQMVRGMPVAQCRTDGSTSRGRIGGLYATDGLRRVEVDAVGPGDVVAVAGLESARIGETLSDPERPIALPAIEVDEPTIAVTLRPNDSPTAYGEGAGQLRERLYRELLTNVAIRVEEADSPEIFRLAGRSELQLAMLIEMMRREGLEMLADRPQVLTREIDGVLHEPMEALVVDCPEAFVGVLTEKVAARRGRMTRMVNHGTGRVRTEFRIPARGLIGLRTEILNDTRGTGIVNHVFDGYGEWNGEIPHRSSGSLVADRPGQATAYAIDNLQPRGTIFVGPGDEVYAGMIVGENSRREDLAVNVTKRRQRSELPVEWAREPAANLLPKHSMSLEQALEFIRADELVEITPRALRLRKRALHDV